LGKTPRLIVGTKKQIMLIRPYQAADQDAVGALWERCQLTRPWNDPVKDIQRKLSVEPGSFLIGVIEESIVATIMVGYDGHRGWVNYLAVEPSRQKSGLGRAMMAKAEKLLAARGCPKLNLQVRSGNAQAMEFYKRLGYGTDDVISMGKRLIADN